MTKHERRIPGDRLHDAFVIWTSSFFRHWSFDIRHSESRIMIQIDYWNHPLIVKAIRVKYRGGRLFILASTYLVLLMAGGVMLFHYRDAMGIKDWARVYFVCMIGLQFGISSMIAIAATSSSMQS